MSKQAQGWKPQVPALDADDERLDKVRKDVSKLQDKHKLGDAHIYRSSENSYHTYFFYDSDRDREEILDIIRESEVVDEEFQEFQEKRSETRMRVKGKHKEEIEKVEVVESEHDGDGHPQRAQHLIRTFERMKKR